MRQLLVLLCAAGSALQAQTTGTAPAPARASAAPGLGALSIPNADPFPSTYKVPASRAVLITNATVLTAAGPQIDRGYVLMRDGKIVSVGSGAPPAAGDAEVIDANGRYVTPGLIDTHSHMGAGAAPGGQALSDINEGTNPVTGHVWVEHSVWPQDAQFPRVLAGGVTTLQILPGSANLIGGRSVVLKVVPSTSVQGMKFPGARYGLKMACGENPKRFYAARGPATRMANVAGYRAAWIQAEAYRRRWDKWLADRQGDPPARDLAMETLSEVLRGNILVQNHCYRADEMLQMIDIAKEFGYRIRSFHHGVEAYKLADVMARDSISGSLWSDWGGFKMEAIDGIRANLSLVHNAGARAIVHSDDASGAQRLNQDAAKARAAGAVVGINIDDATLIRWVTYNPAWALDLHDKIGSLEPGKNADVVLWSANPFSVYARPDRVWIDGAPRLDRADPRQAWRTDFELGYVPAASTTTGGRR